MKANRKFSWNEDRAEVGIGTLIVFIAMVLVAAVAAAVLINTSGNLQQRAQSTGEGATKQSSENLKLMNIEGQTNSSKTKMALVSFTLSLASGAQPIDLEKLTIAYSNGTAATKTLIFSTSASDLSASSPTFKSEIVRLIKNTASTGTILYAGEMVKLTIGQDANPSATVHRRVELDPRTTVKAVVTPEFGAPLPVEFTTPNIYNNVYLQIR